MLGPCPTARHFSWGVDQPPRPASTEPRPSQLCRALRRDRQDRRATGGRGRRGYRQRAATAPDPRDRGETPRRVRAGVPRGLGARRMGCGRRRGFDGQAKPERRNAARSRRAYALLALVVLRMGARRPLAPRRRADLRVRGPGRAISRRPAPVSRAWALYLRRAGADGRGLHEGVRRELPGARRYRARRGARAHGRCPLAVDPGRRRVPGVRR